MKKLVLFISYLGTNYRGLQRTTAVSLNKGANLDSVQGILEFGLQKVLHLKTVALYVSSRTDRAVHAHDSTLQFDLDPQQLQTAYSPERICQSLNLFLEKNECDIRVRRIVEAPLDFSCRSAFGRTYEYRLAVFNEEPHNVPGPLRFSSATNIRELYRCTPIPQPFDFTAVQEASKLFVGRWDFTSFMKVGPEAPITKRVKTLRKFSVSPEVISPDREWDPYFGSLLKPPYDVYNFSIEGSGFLRRQVRRMVGALIAVGRGFIGPKDILFMLENPSERHWNGQIPTLGPDGLYLKQIKYTTLNVQRGYLS